MLKDGNVSTWLPAQDLERARSFYSSRLGSVGSPRSKGTTRQGVA